MKHLKKFESILMDDRESIKEEIMDILQPLLDHGFKPRILFPASLKHIPAGSPKPSVHSELYECLKIEIQLEKPISSQFGENISVVEGHDMERDIFAGIDNLKKQNELIYSNMRSILLRLEKYGKVTKYEDTASIRGYIKIYLDV